MIILVRRAKRPDRAAPAESEGAHGVCHRGRLGDHPQLEPRRPPGRM